MFSIGIFRSIASGLAASEYLISVDTEGLSNRAAAPRLPGNGGKGLFLINVI